MEVQKMGSFLQEGSSSQSIAIFRALRLGDLLCAIPAFRALRAALPEAGITLISLPWAKIFVERFKKYIDDFMEFPGFPGMSEQKPDIKKIPQFFSSAQERCFDLAIQMHGNGRITNSIIELIGAKKIAGFYHEEGYCPDHTNFIPYPEHEHEHEILINLRLVKFLGAGCKGDYLEFPLEKKDLEDLCRIRETQDLEPGSYVCVHPGASMSAKRWSPDKFAAVSRAIYSHGLRIVLTGTMDEAGLVGYIGETMKIPYLNLAGRTSLGALAVLIKNARLLISNDTGVSHLASAFYTPSIIITTSSDPERWSPLDKDLHRTVYYPVPCRPCHIVSCPGEHLCSKKASAKKVIQQAEALLAKEDHTFIRKRKVS